MRLVILSFFATMLMACGPQEFEGRWKLDDREYEEINYSNIIAFEKGEIHVGEPDDDEVLHGTYRVERRSGSTYFLIINDDEGRIPRNHEIELEMVHRRRMKIEGQSYIRIE